jgi:hypothetical protein
MLNDNEMEYIKSICDRITKLRNLMNEPKHDYQDAHAHPERLFRIVKKIKDIIGCWDNNLSFLACMFAKQYLVNRSLIQDSDWNTADKPQGAPGLDIDLKVKDKRIIGEIKTTYPCEDSDLGANQKKQFVKDFEKLAKNSADYKFFFVTEEKTFEIVKQKYNSTLHGVTIVLLPDQKEYKVE